MTRSEAIAIINAKLADLNDEAVAAVAGIVRDIGTAGTLPRPLTPRERALIEQSKTDFREGRTYALDEARQRSDAFIETLRLKYPQAP